MTKQYPNSNVQNKNQYDLEERTFNFAKNCREFVKKIPRNISNLEDSKQLVRSSGSVAANYIEANESLSKKDFCLRTKICRKEAKESRLWLCLIDVGNSEILLKEKNILIQEATELTKIFNSIAEKSK